MRALAILIIATISFSFLSCEKNDPEPTDNEINGLEIEISGIRNNEGVIQLELTDENENVLQHITAEIDEGKSTISLSDLSYGTYAFKYFHDENSNEELDTNLGFPQEGYGFSNNAVGTFGPPVIEDMIFEYDKPLKMECTITYLF
jgi:uncharacterized protein (DUF2141 family)